MRIKLAILESDEIYLTRLVSIFNVRYADKLEIYSFTKRDEALAFLQEKKMDVLLANESFEVEISEIPSKCGYASLVDEAEIETVRGHVAICKFQKAEIMYRQILGVFSEMIAATTGVHMSGDDGCKVLAFLSAAGGTGSSVASAACAMHHAERNKRVLYLNLERFGSADVFFHAEGNATLSDVIYAVKSRKGNLSMKLESTVKHDPSGVYFYSSAKTALDTAELGPDETSQVISLLKMSGAYDYIIMDLDFSLDKKFLTILSECSNVVFVADGSQVSNVKLQRAIQSLGILEQQYDMKILMRSGIMYNRFSSQTSRKVTIEELKELGGINRYEGFDTSKLLNQLKAHQVFDALM